MYVNHFPNTLRRVFASPNQLAEIGMHFHVELREGGGGIADQIEFSNEVLAEMFADNYALCWLVAALHASVDIPLFPHHPGLTFWLNIQLHEALCFP